MSYHSLTSDGLPCKPTLLPAPRFDPKSDAERLKKSMDGLGTDENMIIEILGHRTFAQRKQIASTYKSLFGVDLKERLSGELSGDFGELVDLLFFTPSELKAYVVRKAMKGLGTDEKALLEIICTSTNVEIQELKEEYAKLLQLEGKQATVQSLEQDVKSETSGDFRRILIALLQAQRPEPTSDQLSRMLSKGVDSFVDKKSAKNDAEKLYNAGEKIFGTDEAVFIEILCTRSPWQLMAISKEYEKISKLRLMEAIENEMSGDLKKACTLTLACCINRASAFANLLRSAMAGLGTDDDKLMRIIVWRSEIDLGDIMNAYLVRYNGTLEDAVKGDTSGDYRKLLLALMGCA